MLRNFLVVGNVLVVTTAAALAASPAVEFNRDVRPILARNCFPCHGPDEESREADMRLDHRQFAIDAGAIQPEDLAESTILQRIQTDDPDLVMPPPDSGKLLDAKQRQVIADWVSSGANYETHWSFVAPSKTRVPVSNSNWAHTPMDEFLLAKMKPAGLEPAQPADAYTLVRRLYQDLTGLLPSPSEADRFVQDTSPNAYERLVDRLLASPQYGQHWARSWLDLARYSDTNGYEKDRPRSIWPYRDWVVDALNDDMPFDQFTVEQLAGDMLPNPDVSQRIATGFHRNTMLNEEGGIDPLEYRFYAMVDRVATTGTVWMGLTVGCAQCHTHKYDPITHTDYYRMLALLDNADEPDLRYREVGAKDETINQNIQESESQLVDDIIDGIWADGFSEWIKRQQKHAARWSIVRPTAFRSNLPKLERLDDDSLFASGDFTKRDEYFIELDMPKSTPITAIRIEAMPDDRLPDAGPGRTYYEGRKGQFFLSELEFDSNEAAVDVTQASVSNSSDPFELMADVFDGDGSTGWSNGGQAGERQVLVAKFKTPVAAERLDVRMLFERHFVASLGRFRFSVTTDDGETRALAVSADAEDLLAIRDRALNQQEQRRLALEFLRTSPSMAETRKPVEALRRRADKHNETLVMQERSQDNRRVTHRHHRGEWLNPQEEVDGNVPAIFSQLPSGEANRLGFARWLVSKDNPLFARVVVNRAWRHFMGVGFVRSDGDFGTQASPPTHPELLDWMATEFVERGMSMKWLHRQIVLSAAYRQQSHVAAEVKDRDPENEYFARGPRHRVRGETIRDMMLLAGDTLSSKMGGPSVRPPQPSSVTAIAYGNAKWDASQGEDRYRRSLYTHSKRTAPFAAFTTFDGPSGETCVAKRNRSNTPLQALTLLNDDMFVELARHIGRTAYRESEKTSSQIEVAFRRLLTRPPRGDEMEKLIAFHERQLQRLRSGDLSANEIGGDETTDTDLAALIMVSRVIMNLDETITKH